MRQYKLTALLLAALWATPAAFAQSGVDQAGIDPNTRAQDDLFRAANGNWLATTEIPADRAGWGSFSVLNEQSKQRLRDMILALVAAEQTPGSEADKIAKFHRAYMNTDAVQKQALSAISPWLDRIDALKDKDELARLLGEMSRAGLSGPIDVYVQQDRKQSDRYLAHMSQAGLGLPERDYYLKKDARFKQARSAYQQYLTQLMTLSGESRASQKAADVLAFETRLATVNWDATTNQDATKTYNKRALDRLNKEAPGMNWSVFLDAAGLATAGEANIEQPSYMAGLAKLLAKAPLATWQTYLKVRLLDNAAPYLHRPFEEAAFKFHDQALSGTPQEKPRIKKAVEAAEGSLGEALGKLYVERYFPADSKKRVEQMVENLMTAYRQSIDNLSWMTPATKEKAREKLSKYQVKIGYPNKWRDYSKLEIKDDDLAGNMLRVQRFKQDFQLAHLGQPVDREEWGMTPQTVNAYYSPNQNEIVFPAAILQPPFFNAEADDAVNYGAIGAIIGHEISHGFDTEGSKFDGNGNLVNWWQPADRAAFEKLADQLVAQYNRYEVLPGKFVNGRLTVTENIADLSGLQIAYKAYHLSLNGQPAPKIDGYTGDQRFFLGWAQGWRAKLREPLMLKLLVSDPHSPGHFRTNGAALNTDSFHEAFGTKQGDKMFKPQAERIRIW
ncbi:putative endopeptidase [Chitinivorax tropicus]|uniref:Putative endopeptidase n=1 Tax=Chitinivorax tropicus TaxID=714531 RepID=A0A840MEC0_9PROT|nr:M13-type metalloendopeptidase [Chitinivorax tropicus]MBB5017624.1 putative endopeptidase [Chitinivorax tropicus]